MIEEIYTPSLSTFKYKKWMWIMDLGEGKEQGVDLIHLQEISKAKQLLQLPVDRISHQW